MVLGRVRIRMETLHLPSKGSPSQKRGAKPVESFSITGFQEVDQGGGHEVSSLPGMDG
jgi:hypothetical protein